MLGRWRSEQLEPVHGLRAARGGGRRPGRAATRTGRAASASNRSVRKSTPTVVRGTTRRAQRGSIAGHGRAGRQARRGRMSRGAGGRRPPRPTRPMRRARPPGGPSRPAGGSCRSPGGAQTRVSALFSPLSSAASSAGRGTNSTGSPGRAVLDRNTWATPSLERYGIAGVPGAAVPPAPRDTTRASCRRAASDPENQGVPDRFSDCSISSPLTESKVISRTDGAGGGVPRGLAWGHPDPGRPSWGTASSRVARRVSPCRGESGGRAAAFPP